MCDYGTGRRTTGPQGEVLASTLIYDRPQLCC